MRRDLGGVPCQHGLDRGGIDMDKTLATRAGFSQERLDAVPTALKAISDAGDLSGFVTLTWRKGEVAQLNIIGKRDLERGLPMERDTLFRIASMTKPVTSAAALMLWEEGKFHLD